MAKRMRHNAEMTEPEYHLVTNVTRRMRRAMSEREEVMKTSFHLLALTPLLLQFLMVNRAHRMRMMKRFTRKKIT